MIKSTSKLQSQLPIKELEKPIEIVDKTEKHNSNICPFCGGQLV